MANVFVCSGQGGFQLGMGQKEYETLPVFRENFDKISEFYGMSLPDLCWGRSRFKVKTDPHLAHIVLWGTNYSLDKMLKSQGLQPTYYLGHSLGEVIAYCLGGAFSFEDACRLISKRGELFKLNQTGVESDMIALIGTKQDHEAFGSLDWAVQGVFAANYNTSKQIVYACEKKSFESVFEAAKIHNLKAVPLGVGNGCHSPLVQWIQRELNGFLEEISFSTLEIPVWSTVEGGVVQQSDHVREILEKQVILPVLFSSSIGTFIEDKRPEQFIDLNFANVMKGLLRENYPEAVIVSAQSLAGI